MKQSAHDRLSPSYLPKSAYGSMPLEPAETIDVDPILPSRELLLQGTIS